MQERFHHSPAEAARMSTEEMRAAWLMDQLFTGAEINLVYSHYDRIITGGCRPGANSVSLHCPDLLKAGYFLERRELGIINLGAAGKVVADGETYPLEKMSCLYLGKGVKEVSFSSDSAESSAAFLLVSAPAHQAYPTTLYTKEQAAPVDLGSAATSNERTIFKYIHEQGIQSCQLVMGLTLLKTGSVWNSVPPHTHTRRTEVYCYFDLADDQRLFHFMGEPQETRHLVMGNLQAVIAAPWSVHFGCGTGSYGFVWAMAGENKTFTDMDAAPVPTLL